MNLGPWPSCTRVAASGTAASLTPYLGLELTAAREIVRT